MNKRQEKKQQTRAFIRMEAKKLFIEHGFEGTTSRQIAKAAGVASGTIFVHFPNKQAILVDILFEDIERVVSQVMSNLPNENVVEQLLFIARSLFEYYAKHPELSRVLLRYTLIQGIEESRFQVQIEQFISGVEQLIVQDSNSLPKKTGAMAEAYVAAYFFVLMNFLRNTPLNIDQAMEKLEKMCRVILE